MMAKGKVVQVIGTVVDIEFPPGELPALFNALEIPAGGSKVILEGQGHPGKNVGRATLGRLFDVMGTPLDNLGEVKATDHWPIHRTPPSFEDQETSTAVLETGLK